ncbi:MAG: FMN-binding negative transcriptional regulator [Fimbriimonadaceae bacterium]
MYIPKHFEQASVEVMHDLIRERPLATIVTWGVDGLSANHIPLHLSPSPSPYGTLLGHVARANSMWRDSNPAGEALAIFHGPDAYVSPSWYATKRETGKVVPTWNYAVVHAYGKLVVHDDPAWVRTQLDALTLDNEAPLAAPWTPEDAPAGYIEKLTHAIVGIEIVVTRLLGKWKVSQNQPPENRAGVVAGLETRGSLDMATLVMDVSQQPSTATPPQN